MSRKSGHMADVWCILSFVCECDIIILISYWVKFKKLLLGLQKLQYAFPNRLIHLFAALREAECFTCLLSRNLWIYNIKLVSRLKHLFVSYVRLHLVARGGTQRDTVISSCSPPRGSQHTVQDWPLFLSCCFSSWTMFSSSSYSTS